MTTTFMSADPDIMAAKGTFSFRINNDLLMTICLFEYCEWMTAQKCTLLMAKAIVSIFQQG